MRWPWVSRELVDEVKRAAEDRVAALEDQVSWLREQERTLVEQLVRLQRTRNGLPETGERPKPRVEPMPKELKDYIRSFSNRSVQKQQSDTAFARYRAGESWDEILQGLRREDEGGEPWEKTR